MNGTILARQTLRQRGLRSELTGSTAGVFAALAVSACVSAGAAWVAIDYILSPFAETETAAALAPAPVTAPAVARGAEAPFAQATLSPLGTFHVESDAEATLPRAITEAPRLAATGPLGGTLPTEDAAEPAVRRIAGQPPILSQPRPGQPRELVRVARALTAADARALPGPSARPTADFEIAGAVQAALTEAFETAPAPRASTFPAETADLGDGVDASPRPGSRPANFAAVVASARRPNQSEEPSGIEVARAPAADLALTPASVRPPEIAGVVRTGSGNLCGARALTRAIPGGGNQPGSAIVGPLEGMGGSDRDARVLDAAFRGQVPDFLRDLHPVTISGNDSSGRAMAVTICVMPDYFAVGTNRDFVRVPLGLPAALRLAERYDMMLPTPRMVDQIYAAADLRLSPQPMNPGPQMTSTGYFMRHDAMVDEQYARTGRPLGLLVAGHKKDVVLANRLSANPTQVAIYGWHRGTGSPIQPLSTVHGAQYADYSHGIRLVSRTAYVGGRAMDLGQLLTDAQYAWLLNSDGPITGRAVQMASLR
ncbi:hypothetical protein HKCCE2091_19570 [Rhodobacterales bacterium HKCCE2091]|nr:hypothetical protein [Rhodobacterales bacterium HKCCE2091]